MFVATQRTVNAEPEIIHVTLLHFLARVLKHALWLAAHAVLGEEAANWHPILVELVEEAALLALHAQAPQPMPAYRLTEVLLAHVLRESWLPCS